MGTPVIIVPGGWVPLHIGRFNLLGMLDMSAAFLTPARRRIVSLGAVPARVVDAAANVWRAQEVGGTPAPSDATLVIFDPDRTEPASFVAALTEIGQVGATVGVLPVYPSEIVPLDVERWLGRSQISVDLARCRFRLVGTAAANAPAAPFVLRRAMDETPAAVAADLDAADILFLGGHSGPVDGSFGSLLTLCTRGLHRPAAPVFFPCAGGDRCFRQPGQGRAETSTAGLVDPRGLGAKLLVLDGCGTLAAPGSIYRYEQSILRALTLSRVQVAVLSIGISATPLSVAVLFMALLARGHSLGAAVRGANQHRLASGSPTSIPGAPASPWVVLGDPCLMIDGLPLVELSGRDTDEDVWQADILAGETGGAAGTLVALGGRMPRKPLDVACDPPLWAHGVLGGGGESFLWLADVRPVAAAARVTLSPRPPSAAPAWRDRLFWLNAGSKWLKSMAATIRTRGHDDAPLSNMVQARAEFADEVEQAVFAVSAARSLEIAEGAAGPLAELDLLMESVDVSTARIVAAGVPYAGARLSHLWLPPWPYDGPAAVEETCACGCAVVGSARLDPIHGLRRIELSCPTCSLLGDVAAWRDDGATRPDLRASMRDRSPRRGGVVRWEVARLSPSPEQGFACAALFDPFRERRLVGSPIAAAPAGCTDVCLALPDDWPDGMAWAALIFAAGGRISLFAFDIDIQAAA